MTCEWPSDDPLMMKYHDEEWGVPIHDDKKLFAKLTLDSFQAGLSWKTILHKRENFRKAFDNLDPEKISKYNERKIQSLLQDAGIIRHRGKIEATINNAKLYFEIQKEFGSFSSYIWSFVNDKTKTNKWKSLSQIPATSPESDAMSKDMKSRGFKFVGSTICYAFMQAAGLVNDHVITCQRYKSL